MRVGTVVKLLQSADAWRRPERFSQLLQACSSDARRRTGHEKDDYPQADYLLQVLTVARAVDAGEVAKGCADSSIIAASVQQARTSAIEALVEKQRSGFSKP